MLNKNLKIGVRSAIVAAMLALLPVSHAFAQIPITSKLQDVLKIYKRGQYPAAFKGFSELSRQGDVYAQAMLGKMYMSGEGVGQDYAKALYWLSRAAERGDDAAQNRLGMLYAMGAGVPQDLAKAAVYYRKAAEQHNPAAQNNLGLAYEEGRGVTG